MSLEPFTLSHIPGAVQVWNAAVPPGLAANARLYDHNLSPSTGATREGRVAVEGRRAVGFVIATAMPGDAATSPPEAGWIEVVAVHPEFQGRGWGTALLDWAEGWLREQGCARLRLGGGLRPFAPSLPAELDSLAFFEERRYHLRPGSEYEWDVAHDLGAYETPPSAQRGAGPEIRPMDRGDEPDVLEFFRREFSGRWRYEFEEFQREGGRPSDYVLLWTRRGVDGFARLTLEDSERPIERFYMTGLPRPWGQLGPIGVSRETRGRGYGAALLDAGLRRLRDLGVRGCIIDWTDLLDFYGKFGFRPYRKYAMLVKDL